RRSGDPNGSYRYQPPESRRQPRLKCQWLIPREKPALSILIDPCRTSCLFSYGPLPSPNPASDPIRSQLEAAEPISIFTELLVANPNRSIPDTYAQSG